MMMMMMMIFVGKVQRCGGGRRQKRTALQPGDHSTVHFGLLASLS
jgi:hypothetical protein